MTYVKKLQWPSANSVKHVYWLAVDPVTCGTAAVINFAANPVYIVSNNWFSVFSRLNSKTLLFLYEKSGNWSTAHHQCLCGAAPFQKVYLSTDFFGRNLATFQWSFKADVLLFAKEVPNCVLCLRTRPQLLAQTADKFVSISPLISIHKIQH